MNDHSSQPRRHPFSERMLMVGVTVLFASVAPAQGRSWNSVGPSGTYVRVIRIDPRSGALYAGLVADYGHTMGGVVKSTDGGTTWNDTGLPSGSATYALTLDPMNPSTVYVGLDNYLVGGGGMYKSTDGGTSWTQLSVHPDWGYLSIAVNWANPAVVFAGTDSWGMLMSSDGGNSWSAVNNGLPPQTSVNVVVFDTQTSTTIYAGTSNGLYKTVDGGNTWNALYNGLPDPAANIGSIAINPTTPPTLYVGLNGYSGMDGGGVFVSTDGGTSFNAASNGLPTAYGVHTIAIDPVTPTNIYAGTFGLGAYISTDGGNSWSDFNNGLPDLLVHSIAINPQNPMTVYAGTCNTGVYVTQ